MNNGNFGAVGSYPDDYLGEGLLSERQQVREAGGKGGEQRGHETDNGDRSHHGLNQEITGQRHDRKLAGDGDGEWRADQVRRDRNCHKFG